MARRRKLINPAHGLAVRLKPAELLRFLAKVELDEKSGCWNWKGHCDDKGYGQFHYGSRAHWAHRISYVVFRGKLRDGMEVDHNHPRRGCHNPSCVNPDHLRPLSHGENSAEANRRRARAKVEVECDVPF